MKTHPKAPQQLEQLQMWFGSIISRPIDLQSRINPITPSGRPIDFEAAKYIKPSPTLKPGQRIELYNQQYWWRLSSALHEIFPFLVRLFGYQDFNCLIVNPFLVKYPPDHWSIALAGNRLPQWIEEEYEEDDKKLVLDAARMDLAFNQCVISKREQPISMDNLPTKADPSSLFGHSLRLQAYVHLFELDYDLFAFRTAFLKEDPDFWLDHDFPPLDKTKKRHMVLFRTPGNRIDWKEIPRGEFMLLKRFQNGSTIEDACEWIESQNDEESLQKLHLWFQEWIIFQWLYLYI